MPPGKTRVEWRGGAPAARPRTRCELFAAQKTSRRIAGAGKGRWCERGAKEYETEQLKLGTVPAGAHTISAKSLLTLPRPPARLWPRLIWHKSEWYGRHVRIVMGLPPAFVVVTRGLLAWSNFVTEISRTFLRTEIYRPTFPRTVRTHRRLGGGERIYRRLYKVEDR